MTAVIHHGAPGSYKTFSIVQRVLIPALQAGRVVITNIRGFNSIDRIRDTLKIDIPDSAQILYLEPDENGYQTLARFFHWAPAGALIAMDEGQRVYPLRDKRLDHLDQPADIVICDAEGLPLVDPETGKHVCRPSNLENAIDQHRHYNWDIYISTPNVAKIHSEIRKCVEWAYRHRDNSGLLPWLKNSWTEFRHDAEQNGKSVSHYSGSPKRYKADKKIFDCYQSTATGTAKTSNENISVFRDPKLRIFGLVFVIAFSVFVYQANKTIDRLNGDAQAISEQVPSPGIAISSTPDVLPDNDRADINPHKVVRQTGVHVNPIAGLKLFFTGSINDALFFEVEIEKDTFVPVGIDELTAFGYTLKQRLGSFVVFDLNGAVVYALPKPRMPLQERVATMERSATDMGFVNAL
ncbi:MAG TPA: zonular occludens toxin domain-containing protein [Cellvibrio sp.]|nr:zonular occludens toxin domain-containing protein [Cellvibrio sp.]